ncbi:urea transport system ATP-binding protein [Bacillus niacini]|jgi:urea transport system ATP-binding protein|uniref:Urea transport system ATP-binding protein n=2 Tax=Neobacillus TaxID=2675232 RepID=A0A852TKL0_9BACI|nr:MULTISPECIES: urea ABC transporter ATP-binding protein UrtD [Neobacillus]MDP5197910.1 urea ABC transporter ATP-binding protein UrtD [Neobacillus sp. 179.-C4.2 HS]NYE09302.1 urea transport system ATP-binding protein [Neobacillus niacini]
MINSQTVLESKKITVEFSGFKAISNLDFKVTNNKVHFLIGPNGAGKTTLLDVICGKTQVSQGKVVYMEDQNLVKLKDFKIVHIGISRKFQTPSIFQNLTVYENLIIALKQDKGLWATITAKITKNQQKDIDEMLQLTGLIDEKDQQAGALSHGQKQWLEIAMVLLQDPGLVLLDEPIAGMSKVERLKTGEMIREIAKDRTVLIVEHDMDFVKEYADIVTVMHEGKLLCQGSMEEIQNDPRVREVYLGRKED